MSILSGFLTLGQNINKSVGNSDDTTKEGVITDYEDVLTLKMDDEELLRLKNRWEERWNDSEAKRKLTEKQKQNEEYWKGEHYSSKTGAKELVDNVLFESLETFLAVAKKKVAEPVITADDSPEGQDLSKKVENRIVDLADTMLLRLKVGKAVRHWSLFFLGCVKIGWSNKLNDIVFQTVRPQQLILDPDAITDECEYEGEYLGHFRDEIAGNLIKRFPEKAEKIKELVKGKKGSKVRFVEWWTEDYLFWTVGNIVLGKSKNPHWNYDEDRKPTVDEFGGEVAVPAFNHFLSRKIPFGFLSVFNLGLYPYDDTNPVEQVISLQDKINKRNRQIDKNADEANGGFVLSSDSVTESQAQKIQKAVRSGGVALIPGDVNKAYKRDSANSLPNFIYQDLIDSRNELRSVFGATGITAQGLLKEKTVRGKVLLGQKDTDRAAPVIDQIEQLYDYIFNWILQMIVVYYDTPRGRDNLQASDINQRLIVNVKEGSLIPKDRLSERNEAIDLWATNAISAVDLYKKLEFPNPEEMAKNLLLWQMVSRGLLPPQVIFPDFPSPNVPIPPGFPQNQPASIAPERASPELSVQNYGF